MKLQKYWNTRYRKKSERWNLQIRFFLHFSSLLSLCHQCPTPESDLQHIFHFFIYSILSTWNVSCTPDVLSEPSNCLLIIWILIVISFFKIFYCWEYYRCPHFPPFDPSTRLLPQTRPSLHYRLCPWCYFLFCVFLSQLHFLFDFCFSI